MQHGASSVVVLHTILTMVCVCIQASFVGGGGGGGGGGVDSTGALTGFTYSTEMIITLSQHK